MGASCFRSAFRRFEVSVWLATTEPFEVSDRAIRPLIVERDAARSESLRFEVRATSGPGI
jgi:hypothetical protein